MTDPTTGKRTALSEVERRQEHIDKMSGVPDGLRPLVTECLQDYPAEHRPSISDVSERIKSMKEIENARHPHVNMSPNTWQVKDTTMASLSREDTVTLDQATKSQVHSKIILKSMHIDTILFL